MSKIQHAFANGKAFIAFVTAGDPSADKTVEFILAMAQAGADLVEIGIPFSDPVAEGIVIQQANERALKGGVNTDKVFEIVSKVRAHSNVPLVFLTYINPVFHYGYERFFAKCEQLGVDGIIIPDLPYEEKAEIAAVAKAHGVDIISLIAPTSEERIAMIAREATGFVYVVSSMGVTGVRSQITTDLPGIVATIKKATATPVAIGFGIHSPEQAAAMTEFADGAIVGSAIVKIIAEHGAQATQHLVEYVRDMKQAVAKA